VNNVSADRPGTASRHLSFNWSSHKTIRPPWAELSITRASAPVRSCSLSLRARDSRCSVARRERSLGCGIPACEGKWKVHFGVEAQQFAPTERHIANCLGESSPVADARNDEEAMFGPCRRGRERVRNGVAVAASDRVDRDLPVEDAHFAHDAALILPECRLNAVR
jgi:hypothetical protein